MDHGELGSRILAGSARHIGTAFDPYADSDANGRLRHRSRRTQHGAESESHAAVFQTSGVAARSGEQDFGSSTEKIVPPSRVDTTLMSPPCERAI